MSIIEASFVKVAGTLADGTLRLVVDVEPRNAQAAFALFNSPGTPMALAALKPGYAAVAAAPKEPAERTGPLCREAVGYCQLPAFQQWIHARADLQGEPSEQSAKDTILAWCNVESRKELDADGIAGEAFVKSIRVPFLKHMRGGK